MPKLVVAGPLGKLDLGDRERFDHVDDPKIAMWILERRRPETWGKQDVQVQVSLRCQVQKAVCPPISGTTSLTAIAVNHCDHFGHLVLAER